MSQPKAKETTNLNETTRKVCSRAKEHTKRNTPEAVAVTEQKHTGMKFNLKKNKVTVVKPFSFDTSPNPKKVTSCHLKEKSIGKQTNTEEKQKVSVKHVRITTEHLKISNESQKCSTSRSVSRERKQKDPVNSDASIKKACTRCSRTPKSEVQPPKKEKSPVRTTKSQDQASKVTKSEGKSVAKSKPQNSKIAKTKTATKPEVKVSCVKGCSNAEKTKSKPSDEAKPKPDSPDVKKPDSSNAEEATEPELPNGLEMKSKHEPPNAENLESLSGLGTIPESDPSAETRPESDISIGGKTEEELNEINLECELSNALFESVVISKSTTSKIPRKQLGHSGLKFPTGENLKKETIPQPFSFENRCSNLKKEIMNNEANTMQIANMVNN